MDQIIYSAVSVICGVIGLIQLLFFIRAIMSWFPVDTSTAFYRFLYAITEAFITPVRNIIEKTRLANSMLDISFLIAFLILEIIKRMIIAIV